MLAQPESFAPPLGLGPKPRATNCPPVQGMDAPPRGRMAYLGTMPTLDPIPELKIILAKRLIDRLDGWSQEAAGELLRADQPRVSNLRNQRLDRFSLDRMVRFVAALGGEVSLEVTWTRHGFI